MDLKVKLIKDKPKVYAVNLISEQHLTDLIKFLTDTKDKKFDIIINGKLIKFANSTFKNKFLEGFTSRNNISINGAVKPDANKLNNEAQKLKREAEEIKKIKELCDISEASTKVMVDVWKDRITELEDTCQTLRDLLDKK